MFTLAYRNLTQDKTKLLISVSGVAFSVLLIMVLVGVYQGLSSKLGEYIQTIPADLWVAQQGSGNLFDSTSVLSASSHSDIRTVPGVKSVKQFNGRQIAVQVGDDEKRAFVVSLGDKSGAPTPKIIAGTADIRPGQIILDRSIKGIALGQQVTVGGQQYTIAGITEGGNVLIVTYAFMATADAARLFKQDETVNYFTIDVADEVDSETVANGIETVVPGSKVMSGQAFVNDTTSIVKEVFLPIIAVLSVIGIAVGVTVIGLTIFTSTMEKAKEYGVLKAVGVSDRQLYLIVLQQSLLTSILGYVVGIGFGFALITLASKLVPEFIASIELSDAVMILGATLIMGAVAALLPAHKITKIDPAEVFKA